MWTILKFDNKRISSLKKDLESKLGKDLIIYYPKILVETYKKNKIIKKEYNILGDYLFCYHTKFTNQKKAKIVCLKVYLLMTLK